MNDQVKKMLIRAIKISLNLFCITMILLNSNSLPIAITSILIVLVVSNYNKIKSGDF